MEGGIAIFLSELICGLAKCGNEVRVLVNKMPKFEEYDKNQAYPIIRYLMPERLSSLHIGWQLFRQIMRMKPDVLFVGHVMATRGLPVLLFRWFLKIPYVVLCHAGHLPITDASKINDISARTLLRYAELILANSEYTRRLLIERGFPHEKIRILTPGVDTDFFSPSSDESTVIKIRSKYGADGMPRILNIGRLVPKKNQLRIVKAIAILGDQGLHVKCTIAGNGPEKVNLQSHIKELGIDEQVQLIGYASRDKVRELIHAADIVALPSIIDNDDYESFGIVALEASACGKPVIVDSKGGQVDAGISDETGIVVNSEDENNIAKAISYLIERKDIADRMGKAGRQHVVEKFSWNRIAKRTTNLLSSLPR